MPNCVSWVSQPLVWHVRSKQLSQDIVPAYLPVLCLWWLNSINQFSPLQMGNITYFILLFFPWMVHYIQHISQTMIIICSEVLPWFKWLGVGLDRIIISSKHKNVRARAPVFAWLSPNQPIWGCGWWHCVANEPKVNSWVSWKPMQLPVVYFWSREPKWFLRQWLMAMTVDT